MTGVSSRRMIGSQFKDDEFVVFQQAQQQLVYLVRFTLASTGIAGTPSTSIASIPASLPLPIPPAVHSSKTTATAAPIITPFGVPVAKPPRSSTGRAAPPAIAAEELRLATGSSSSSTTLSFFGAQPQTSPAVAAAVHSSPVQSIAGGNDTASAGDSATAGDAPMAAMRKAEERLRRLFVSDRYSAQLSDAHALLTDLLALPQPLRYQPLTAEEVRLLFALGWLAGTRLLFVWEFEARSLTGRSVGGRLIGAECGAAVTDAVLSHRSGRSCDGWTSGVHGQMEQIHRKSTERSRLVQCAGCWWQCPRSVTLCSDFDWSDLDFGLLIGWRVAVIQTETGEQTFSDDKFRTSDIDLFIHGLDAHQATLKVPNPNPIKSALNRTELIDFDWTTDIFWFDLRLTVAGDNSNGREEYRRSGTSDWIKVCGDDFGTVPASTHSNRYSSVFEPHGNPLRF